MKEDHDNFLLQVDDMEIVGDEDKEGDEEDEEGEDEEDDDERAVVFCEK